MYCALGYLDLSKNVLVVSDHNNVKNEWGDDEEVVFQSPSAKKSANDLE